MAGFKDLRKYRLVASRYSPDDPFYLSYFGEVRIGVYANELDGLYTPSGLFDLHVELTIPVPIYVATGEISATLDGITAIFVAKNIANEGIFQNVVLGDMVGGFVGFYDHNVTRWITSQNNSSWNDATRNLDNKTNMLRQQASPTPTKACSIQLHASQLIKNINLQAEQANVLNNAFLTEYEQADLLTNKTELVREQGTFIDRSVCSFVDLSLFKANHNVAVMEQMTKVYPDKWRVEIQDSSAEQHDFIREIYLDRNPYQIIAVGINIDMLNTKPPEFMDYEFIIPLDAVYSVGHSVGIAATVINSDFETATRVEIKQCVLVDEARRPPRGESPWIDDPRPDPPDVPPTGATYTVPIQEVYTMEHIKSVTLEDLTDIEMDDISLKFDTDSFAWQFNGRLLNHGQLDLIKPLPDGSAITLIVTINGYVWHVSADAVNHQRQFGQRSIAIGGRGTSALLTSPNEQKTSGTQGSLLSVQQLADLHLPIGWTIDWQAVTWNVTGGAYSWQSRTPLQAISDIVDFIGAIVLPARDSKTLTIKPRYPVLPWNFAGTPVDIAIPDAAILELTYRQTSRQFANGVYVHGGETGGVLGFARLNGTAGDVLIETQSNPLMTDVIGLRALSERLLAGDYTQPDIRSIKTEMDGTIVPLIEAGTFVGITVDGVETKGIVNGVEITASGADVEQTITLGEETNNQWTAFRSLLPKDPLLVGTVTSTTGTSSIIQLIDGGVVNVRGTGDVNSKVYIRSGQIQGDAPNMVQNDIVI